MAKRKNEEPKNKKEDESEKTVTEELPSAASESEKDKELITEPAKAELESESGDSKLITEAKDPNIEESPKANTDGEEEVKKSSTKEKVVASADDVKTSNPDPEKPSTEDQKEGDALSSADDVEHFKKKADLAKNPKQKKKFEKQAALAEEAATLDENLRKAMPSIAPSVTTNQVIRKASYVKRERAESQNKPYYGTRFLYEDIDDNGVPSKVRIELVEHFNGVSDPVDAIEVKFFNGQRDRLTGIVGLTELELLKVIASRLKSRGREDLCEQINKVLAMA